MQISSQRQGILHKISCPQHSILHFMTNMIPFRRFIVKAFLPYRQNNGSFSSSFCPHTTYACFADLKLFMCILLLFPFFFPVFVSLFTGWWNSRLCSFSPNLVQIFFTFHSKKLNRWRKKHPRPAVPGVFSFGQAETSAEALVYSLYHYCPFLARYFPFSAAIPTHAIYTLNGLYRFCNMWKASNRFQPFCTLSQSHFLFSIPLPAWSSGCFFISSAFFGLYPHIFTGNSNLCAPNRFPLHRLSGIRSAFWPASAAFLAIIPYYI